MTVAPEVPTTALVEDPVVRRRLSLRDNGLQSVAGITAALVGTQAATSLLGFLYWTIATHRFSVPSVGVASVATSTMQLLGTLGMLGFGTLLISRLPSVQLDRRRVLVRSSLVVVVAVSAILGLLFVAGVGLIPSGGLRSLTSNPGDALLFAAGVALTGGTLVIDQAVLITGSGLVQFERNVVASVAKIGFLILLSEGGAKGGMAIYLAWVLGIIASLPVVLYRTRAEGVVIARPRWLDSRILRGTWRDAANHHVLNLALQAPLLLFPAIITLQSSNRSTGYFATVLLLAGFVFVLPYAVSIGLFASGGNDSASVRQRMRLTLPFGIAASLAADVVLIPLAPEVLRVFGANYAAHGTTPLRLVVLAGLSFVVKDHYVALRRVERRPGRAARLILVTSTLEVVAAVVGLHIDGITGLCLVWLGLVYVEAGVFAALLWADLRTDAGRSPATALPVASSSGLAEITGGGGGMAVATLEPALRSPIETDAAAVVDSAPAERAVDDRPRRAGHGPSVFAMAVGVAVEGMASVAGNANVTPAAVDALYWSGLVLIFLPVAWKVISPRASRMARLGFVLALGVLLQLSRFAVFPQFAFHDELAHDNTLRLIETSHRLFSANPLLPVSSYYPGLELCTDALHALLGLTNRQAAEVVLLLCRLVMTLAVFLGIERITRSNRWAALASVGYVCNEQYLFFNSQYSYQSLALPLALLTIYLLLRLQDQETLRRRSLLLPLVVIAATTASHHLTAGLLAAALCVWAVVERKTRGRSTLAVALSRLAPVSVILVVAWALVPGNPVWSYLTQIGASGIDAVVSTFEGKQSHTLFSAAGYRTPEWEVAVSLVSELLILAALVGALRWFWRTRTWKASSLAVLLAGLAIAFPIVPAGHFTSATSEVTDRASGFLCVGLAFVVTGWVAARRPWRNWGWRRRVVLTVALLAAFVGQTILGSGPQWAQTPGSFLVSADSRSLDRYTLAAANWEAANLPAGTRVIADRDDSLLAGSIGGLYPVTHIADGINGSAILLSPTWTAQDAQLVRQLRISYVIVDLRDSTGLPREGVYYEDGEYDENRTTPVPRSALTKLAHVAGVTTVYDNGPMVIYDVQAIEESS